MVPAGRQNVRSARVAISTEPRRTEARREAAGDAGEAYAQAEKNKPDFPDRTQDVQKDKRYLKL